MTLRAPILDDRSFAQIRDELLRMIPVYSKEWTDHNPSDPGVTLLELFAFLGENLLFRFNQIPEATRMAFLELLRIPIRPAQPSTALLGCTTELGSGRPVPRGTSAFAGKIGFETLTELKVWPFTAKAYGRVSAPEPSDAELRDFAQQTVDAAELDAGEVESYYEAKAVELGQRPEDVVDFAATVDRTLWIAVLAPEALPEEELERAEARRAWLAPLAGERLNIGIAFDEVVETVDELEACPGVSPAARVQETIWDASLHTLVGGAPKYQPLRLRGDTTRGLRDSGVVRLELPENTDDVGVPLPPEPDLEGTRAFPPAIGEQEQARLLFWVRAYRRGDEASFGRVLWVGANATNLRQTRTAPPELLGTGDAQPDQTFSLTKTPVIPGDLVVEVEEQRGRFVPYARVDGFWASGVLDRHFVLDPEAGTVRFGRNRGRVPQIGERVRATTYRHGGGEVGNVAAETIDRLEGISDVECANPVRARGGADREPLEDALDRIPGELRRRDRMVTADDTRELALMTPGAAVGRAEVIPTFDPRTQEEAAGVVTVVAWPKEDRRRPSAPMPTRSLLESVCAFLDARRLVTTELWVIPPTYVPIAVSIGVEVKPGYGIDAVRAWVETVVRQYLAPLPPYGPEGAGWPLGRPVMGRELEAAALQVEGVRYLEDDVRVASWDDATGAWVRVDRDVLELARWQVPELRDISVVQGPPLDPGEAFAPDLGDKVPVPIPVIEDEC